MTNTSPNEEQVRYWNEQSGPKWVRLQERLDAQLDDLGVEVMTRAGVQSNERAVDVGCGCGHTSLQLTERVGPGGSVIGVDISAPMLERARARGRERGANNLEFLLADAQTHAFDPQSVDLIYSRFGIMFFEDPAAAFQNLHRALRPGGRLAFICWQGLEHNDWVRVPLGAALNHLPPPEIPPPGAPGPFAFADPDRVRRLLTAAGFSEVQIAAHTAAMTLGGTADLDEAVAFLLDVGPVSRLLQDASPDLRARVRDAVRAALAPYAEAGGVRLAGATWIVTGRP
jgi:SAM-dependent methyltransferase